MSLKRKMKKGFTLVELVVVIAVIAILSAVSVGAYFGITDSANKSAAEQEAKAFHTNLVLYANTPNREVSCSITEDGLWTEDFDTLEAEVLADAGTTYTGYTIGFCNDVAKKTVGSKDYYRCISFKTAKDVTVHIDVVTGAISHAHSA